MDNDNDFGNALSRIDVLYLINDINKTGLFFEDLVESISVRPISVSHELLDPANSNCLLPKTNAATSRRDDNKQQQKRSWIPPKIKHH